MSVTGSGPSSGLTPGSTYRRPRTRRTSLLLCALPAAAGLVAALGPPAVGGLPLREMRFELRGAEDNRICLGCHDSRGDPRPGGDSHARQVDANALAKSAHGSRACTDCHGDVKRMPHGTVAKVRCGGCHPLGENTTAAEGATSAVHEGAHARARREGKGAPGCSDCHGTHGITARTEQASAIHRANIPTTCGRCHAGELRQYEASIHGRAIAQGKLDAAVCTDCHGEHNAILPVGDQQSRVSPLNVPDTCSRCHESALLLRRYHLPQGRYATYRESYHGIIARYGDARAANCASCHGSHDILPSTEPASRVSPARLPETCGKPECHPGAGANFARGTMHLLPSREQDATIYWVKVFYRWFVAGLILQFIALTSLDLLAHYREKRRGGTHA